MKIECNGIRSSQGTVKLELQSVEKSRNAVEKECEGWRRQCEEQERRIHELKSTEDRWENLRKAWESEKAKLEENNHLYRSQNAKLDMESKQRGDEIKKVIYGS